MMRERRDVPLISRPALCTLGVAPHTCTDIMWTQLQRRVIYLNVRPAQGLVHVGKFIRALASTLFLPLSLKWFIGIGCFCPAAVASKPTK
jgi:hypothetical protein